MDGLAPSLAHNANPSRRKLQGYDFYREVLGSPRYVVAPMVDQSELVREVTSQSTTSLSPNWVQAWRILSRRYGAQVNYSHIRKIILTSWIGLFQLAYTPMINAKMYANNKRNGYREIAFNTVFGEEGGPGDRPLIIQFCANDPDQLLASAQALEGHCDAVDINLGCPQDIARKGHYGSFLQDEWDLIYKLSE